MSTNTLPSYPKILNFGHRLTAEAVTREVVVEEKVDGSQFSFGVIDGALFCRSKNHPIDFAAGLHPDGTVDALFRATVATVIALYEEGLLHEGWTYRGEAMKSAKHNTLRYERVPKGHLVLFDVNTTEEGYLSYDEKAAEAARLGLEVVPRLYAGVVNADKFAELLDTVSFLGGPTVEGVVMKPIEPLYTDLLGGGSPKAVMVKYVSESFRELHHSDWKKRNPNKVDALSRVTDGYRTEARWQKAVQQLAEAGTLDNSPRDIGPLIHAVHADILDGPERAELAEALLQGFERVLKTGITKGLPEWYKAKLVEATFAEAE